MAEGGEAATAEEHMCGASVRNEEGRERGGQTGGGSSAGGGNIHGDERNVVVDGEGLGEEVSEVMFAWDKRNSKLVLTHSALYPIETHVDRLAFLWANCVFGQADGTLIVTQDRGGGLGIA
jgi:hypothetical protein